MSVPKFIKPHLEELRLVAVDAIQKAVTKLFEQHPDKTFEAIALLNTSDLCSPSLCAWSPQGMAGKIERKLAESEGLSREDFSDPMAWLIGDWDCVGVCEGELSELAEHIGSLPLPSDADNHEALEDRNEAILITVSKALGDARRLGVFGNGAAARKLILLVHLGDMTEAQMLVLAKACNPPAIYKELERKFSPSIEGKWKPLGSRKVCGTMWTGHRGGRLYAASFRELFVWELPSMTEVFRSVYLPQHCSDMALHSDGGSIWMSWWGDHYNRETEKNEPSGIRRLDLATKSYADFFDGHGNAVWCLDVSADGKWVAAGESDGSVWLWEIASGCGRKLFQMDDVVRQVRFNQNASRLACSGQSRGIAYLELPSGKMIWQAREGCLSLHFSLTGAFLLQANFFESPPGLALVRDTKTGDVLSRIKATGEYARIDAAAFDSTESKLVLSRYKDPQDPDRGAYCELYSWPDMTPMCKMAAGHEATDQVVFLPDNRTVAVAGRFPDGPPLILWDTSVTRQTANKRLVTSR